MYRLTDDPCATCDFSQFDCGRDRDDCVMNPAHKLSLDDYNDLERKQEELSAIHDDVVLRGEIRRALEVF